MIGQTKDEISDFYIQHGKYLFENKKSDSVLYYYFRAADIIHSTLPVQHEKLINIEFNEYDDILRLNSKILNQAINCSQYPFPERSIKKLTLLYAFIGEYFSFEKDFTNALSYYELAINHCEKLLSFLHDQEQKLKMRESFKYLYDYYILLTYMGNNNSSSYKKNVLAALAISDRSRTQILQNFLNNSNTKANDFLFITQRFTNDTGIDYLAHEVKSNLKSIRLFNNAILNYYSTDYGLIYWIYSYNDGVQFGKINISIDSIEKLIGQLSLAIEKGNEYNKLAPLIKELSQVIPKELINYSSQKELIIVPHGLMNRIPFSILDIPESENKVGDLFSIRFAPSIHLLNGIENNSYMNLVKKIMIDKKIKHPKTLNNLFKEKGIENQEQIISFLHENPKYLIDSILIVSNPKMPLVELGIKGEAPIRLSSLSSSSVNISNNIVKGILAGKSIDTVSTETEVIKSISRASLAHFSTHSESYTSIDEVKNSWIAFSEDTINNGLLTVKEILSEDFPVVDTELVVISACSTAKGQNDFGEGTIGLQWALFTKGVKRLITSLWNVDDEATNYLMDKFYDHWLLDSDLPTISTSLKRAQNDLKSTERYANPKYWAAFQLYGAR